MRKNINKINWLLFFSLPILLLTVNIKPSKINSKINPKALATNLVAKVEEKETDTGDLEKAKENQKENNSEVNQKPEETKDLLPKKESQKEEEKEFQAISMPNIFATYQGNMSFYQANCTDCSGITSTGIDISDGRLYYQDHTYGNVRIVAAGQEIKKWSIVRIKNSSLGSSVLAIVLDRGGSIGVGKTFLIDMLTNSNENKDGVDRNITVEVLRNGVS